MNLLEIKTYLKEVKIASIAKLSAHFNCDSDVLRNMMMHWVRKGCIRKFMKEAECGKTCMKCMPQTVEIYEWVV
ncbi:MAG TPA: FeoC-like transcriptional regulator [Gammaproteobacteria bacterium]|nr:FeoC-like transcriptional regulator [Gammaproteobacteria bacterium]